jgi:hypothetical protein
MLDFVLRVHSPQDCSVFPGFKMLTGRNKGQHQFRLSDAQRLRFTWDGLRAVSIVVGEFHDEDK